MSYILDALKKSEAERNQATGVSLLNYADKKNLAGIPVTLIITLTLAVNIIAFLVWTFWPADFSPLQATRELIKLEQRPAAVQPLAKTQLSTPSTPAQEVEVKLEPETKAPASKKDLPLPQVVVSFASLSKIEQERFPEISFSTHVYTDDADFRAIVANGVRLTEGEILTRNIQLITITENGAVFLYANKLVEIPVLQEWRFQ